MEPRGPKEFAAMDQEKREYLAQANGDEAIQLRAYFIYLDRTYVGRTGDELEDWLQAEREVGGREVNAP
jgi:predicted dithiol-disulfide oxidoreductase (DUF899 family)